MFLGGQLLHGEWNLPLWGALTIVWRAAVLGGTAVTILRARDLPLQIGASTLLLAHFVSYFQVWEHHVSAAIVASDVTPATANASVVPPTCASQPANRPPTGASPRNANR